MSASSKIASTKIAKFAWIALAYTLFVILFGAFVRASLSGDGCGAHWPTCHGGLLPHTDFASFAEYTHRITSGLTLVLVGALALASHRVFGRIASVVSGKRSRFASLHPATRASLWALFFTIVSALIGAVLVLFEFVALDRSLGRAITMPLHLINTLFLLGSLGLAGHYARGGDPIQWKGQGAAKAVFLLMAGSMMVLGATGAISALGKTAWQFENVTQSFAAHFAADAHPLLRGGIVHPLLATSVGLLIIWGCGFLAHLRNDPQTKKWARVTVGLYVVQFVFGIVNLLMSAPVWMQLTHLALACFNWLALIMVGAYALRPSYAVAEEPVKDPAPQSAAVSQPRPTVTAYIKDFIAMTKPRVISLLLFTTVAAMVVAQGGWPPLWLILVTCLGGYMMAGASNSFNMLVETDLDQAMGRTAKRPIVSGRISRRAGWIFAFGMAVGAFLILWLSANLLAAMLAFAGLLFYVFIYTLMLKRRTWQNIVIGGAAGAFPPLVGYAAVSGELTPLAWMLFAIVFFWTPVHFWALAILLKDDYAAAGVPMLPVVRGEKVTVIQIGAYAFLTATISILPLLQNQVGPIYFYSAIFLNFVLIAQSLRLIRTTDRPQALVMFKYSMVYLALLFLMIAIDRSVVVS